MSQSYGPHFPTSGINPGHIHYDERVSPARAYMYKGGNSTDLVNNWTLVDITPDDDATQASFLLEHNNEGTHNKSINITNTDTPARSFTIATRDAVSSWPVPYFRPTTADTALAFDIMPNGAAVENGTNGFAWLDVANTDCSATNPAMAAARVGIRSICVEFGSRAFNGGTLLPLYLTMDATVVLAIQTTKDISFGDSTGTNGQRYFTFTNYSNGVSAYTDIQVRSDTYITKYLTLRHYSSTFSYDSSNYADKSEVGAVGSDLFVASTSSVWILPGGGAYSANNNGIQLTTLATLPKVDNNQTMGSATKRWSNGFFTKLTLANLVNAVDDAAAAVGGVAVGEVYRNGSVLMVRVA